MWSLAFIPQWVYYVSLILGVGAGLTNFAITRIIGILLIAGSCWQLGSTYNETAWQTRVQKMEAKVAQAEAKALEANNQVVTQVVTKTKLIKEKTQANVEYITQYVAQDLDSSCKLTNASIMLNNSASQGEVPTSSGGVVTGTSDVKASEFLTTVTENYGTYYQLVEQVKGWQAWYYKQKKIFEE
jgi:hypothetical protein